MNFEPPGGRPWGLFALCGASLLLNGVFITRSLLAEPAPQAVATEAPAPAAVAAPIEEPDPVQPVVDVMEPTPPAEPELAAVPSDVRTASLTVEHSLARTFARGVGDEGAQVAAVVARLFVWDLDLRRDLQKGDRVTLAWEGDGPDLQVPAARYQSKKLGTLTAYRYTAAGDTYPSWWNEDGVEVSRALVDSPIEGYEQITSLLKDRPRHRGMDFKAPVGTDITSPRAGTVTRVNWNTRNNGGCVEVRYADGTLARFLHLSEALVKPGQRVAKGAVLAKSGNSGRSTAPHLHYELDRGGKVVDPVDYHGVTRRTLEAGELARFEGRVSRLQDWLDAADRK